MTGVRAFNPHYRIWIGSFALALLFHMLSFNAPIDFRSGTQLPPRVEIQEMTPEQLDAIRKKWRSQPLLDDKSPAAKEAPKDARYSSDRNIRVEKEQRAKNPVVGLPDRGNVGTRESAQAPKLGDLGVKFKMPAKAPAQSAGSAAIPGPRGDQMITDAKVAEGSENLLNAQESKFYSYFRRMHETIAPLWYGYIREAHNQAQAPEGSYYTIVEAVFNAEGQLVGLNVLESSGVRQYDEAALLPWKKAQRFPNPPTDLLDSQGQFYHRFGFTFTVQTGGGFQILPPERLQ